jgi:hypothetical protein
MPDGAEPGGFIPPETWAWWESRRLRYNLALATSGLLAYALALGLVVAFGYPIGDNWRMVASTTIMLGIGFVVFMFTANLFYFLGHILEAVIKPSDRDGFRRRTFALGFWGSGALPMLFPLWTLAVLLMTGGYPF